MEKVNSYPSLTIPYLCFGLIRSSLIYIFFYYNVSNTGKWIITEIQQVCMGDLINFIAYEKNSHETKSLTASFSKSY